MVSLPNKFYAGMSLFLFLIGNRKFIYNKISNIVQNMRDKIFLYRFLKRGCEFHQFMFVFPKLKRYMNKKLVNHTLSELKLSYHTKEYYRRILEKRIS